MNTAVKKDLLTICTLFNRGELINYVIKNSILNGFYVAHFTTTKGSYRYYFSKNKTI